MSLFLVWLVDGCDRWGFRGLTEGDGMAVGGWCEGERLEEEGGGEVVEAFFFVMMGECCTHATIVR